MKIGFDNNKYLTMQSAHIRERIASLTTSSTWSLAASCLTTTTLPRAAGLSAGLQAADAAAIERPGEIVVVISAEDIVNNKVRGDYGITYDMDVLRLIDAFQGMGLFVGSVCVTMYTAHPDVENFEAKLNSLGIRTFRHYKSPVIPTM